MVIKAEIENIEHQDIELSTYLIASIPPKTQAKFEDPYKYNPDDGLDDDLDAPADQTQESVDAPFTYSLGKHRVKDTEGGDAGGILR